MCMHTLEEEPDGACMAMGADSALLSLTLFTSFSLGVFSLSYMDIRCGRHTDDGAGE
jgi:hypothetical protein